MAARRSTTGTSMSSGSGRWGGALVLLGSLVYLYVFFTWYYGGMAASLWLSTAAFLGPFVVAVAIISAITLFFMGFGAMFGRMGADMRSMMMNVLWRFIMMAGVTTIILTAGGSWFLGALGAFVLTYIGAMIASM